jgi:hypothetical protein
MEYILTVISAVKALQVINRSARLNVDKKSRVRELVRVRFSKIIFLVSNHYRSILRAESPSLFQQSLRAFILRVISSCATTF